MKCFNALSSPLQILLIVIFVVVTYFSLYILENDMENLFFHVLSFLLIFITLFLIFNFRNPPIYSRIFLGLVLGILAGLLFGKQIQIFLPIGKAFIQLIKMIVIPLVFSSLLVGIASINSIKRLGQIGIRTLLFYIVSTILAISIGLISANISKP